MKKYKIKPHAPEILDENGRYFWDLYCRYFLDRNYLTEELLPDLEHLAHMQQERCRMQNEMREDPSRRDYLSNDIRLLSVEIRQYKKHMKIYPRSSEFHKPDSEEKKKEEKIENRSEAKITKLANKNY